jgi:hypothetical protein
MLESEFNWINEPYFDKPKENNEGNSRVQIGF